MKKIQRPPMTAREAFDCCKKSVRDERRRRLESISSIIEQAEDEYIRLAVEGRLHLIEPACTVGNVVGDELRWLYTNQLARLETPARVKIYDVIRKGSGEICSLCGVREVGTLDHYLPQGAHPVFAVTPVNLVPACWECNHEKGVSQQKSVEDQLLHPYFDDVDNVVWLVAEVCQEYSPAIVFKIKSPVELDPMTLDRLKYHLKTLKVFKTFASRAGSELVDMKRLLNDLLDTAGPDGVRQHLEKVAESCRDVGRNSWRVALYAALAASDWFCMEGLRDIGCHCA